LRLVYRDKLSDQFSQPKTTAAHNGFEALLDGARCGNVFSNQKEDKMTKEQELQDLSEARRVLKEKWSAYEKFLSVSPLGEGPPQGYKYNELKRASDEFREAEEKYLALFEKVYRKQ
jgi:hypothetical protein